MKLWVPLTFWLDHADRCPCDDAETEMATELVQSKTRAYIEANAKQLEVLRSDAAYYCDRLGPDETPASIKQSAKRTLIAINKAKQTPQAREY